MSSRIQMIQGENGRRSRGPLLLAAVAAFVVALSLASMAQASKQAVDFFGSEGTLGGEFTSSEGVAVNYTGAGGVPSGTLYVTDGGAFDNANARGNRVQRFQRDDSGTPGQTADDTYPFVAAWGAGVLTGGTDYEICTVAADCKAAPPIGGNGTAAGNGALNKPSGIAVDQDTGNVYVLDTGPRRTPDDNFRVNVYSATGTFLRSFGWDVVESGPGNNGTGYEICVAADGDVCKKGVKGSGTGQIGGNGNGEVAPESIAVSPAAGNPSVGTVFVGDQFNERVNTYQLDGSSPASIGSAAQFDEREPGDVAVDSRGILYLSNGGNIDPRIERYDTLGANGPIGFLAPMLSPINERQEIEVQNSNTEFKLQFDPDDGGPQPVETTAAITGTTGGSQGTAAAKVREALEALPSITAADLAVNAGDTDTSRIFPIDFKGAYALIDVSQLAAIDMLPAGSVTVTTIRDGHDGVLDTGSSAGMAVDPDGDGPGSDVDIFYAGRSSDSIQQFGPVNAPGLVAPPTAEDDLHGTSKAFGSPSGIAVEPPTGRLYAAASGVAGRGIYVLDETSPTPPTASLDSIDGVTSSSAQLHATVDPNGAPPTRYHFEYVDHATYLATGFANAKSLPEVLLGMQETPQAIEAALNPPPIGLEPNTTYHVRIVAGRRFAPPVISNELTFATGSVSTLVETAGAPIRTTTTAQLNGRVTPLNNPASYHFEYGDQGPCSANPCAATPTVAAGSGNVAQLVSVEITGLQPDVTYHYRLVGENGVGAPMSGGDMTVHTRASNELPGQGDEFPGPPGSDRAWEQVSIADSSGNPVGIFFPFTFSNDGNRAVYGIAGGTPISSTGSIQNLYLAQRTPQGWQSSIPTPPRDQLIGQFWRGVFGDEELTTIMSANRGSDTGVEQTAFWRLRANGNPDLLYQMQGSSETYGLSADGSLALTFLNAVDPDYPGITGENVYDISSSPPDLVSLLPGNSPAPCGIAGFGGQIFEGSWISPDGSQVYFHARPKPPCNAEGTAQLYVRDLTADQTTLISGPPLSGADCGGSLIKGIAGAAFFMTASRLTAEDPVDCGAPGANDMYRYDADDGSLDCVTCVFPDFGVGVQPGNQQPSDVAVAEDGSRIYFQSSRHLVSGAPPAGQLGVYRVNVATGDLDYVGPIGNIGTTLSDVVLSNDGSIVAFSSDKADFNPLGGTSDNGGGTQYYRYDDDDRSLICVSCPQDGSTPSAEVEGALRVGGGANLHHNNSGLSDDGGTLAFATPVALLGADQNTPPPSQDQSTGRDIYEWRDGRLILVTDGLTNSVVPPEAKGVSPDGTNVYFTAAAALTPDAPDALIRLYDARIGGGIAFPKPPPPCPLEVCQGTPKGAPEEQPPGTSDFRGPGNPVEATPRPKRCPKGKRKVRRNGKVRCIKPRRHASNDRRANR